MKPKLERFDGYLFSKLHLIGSKSEGPTYCLQQFDYKEIVVKKQVYLWQEDPTLHKFLAKKVTVEGEIKSSQIEYKSIRDYKTAPKEPKQKQLVVKLKLSANILHIKKRSLRSQPSQCLGLKLMVKWPYRSIWEGLCPTSQIYDFSIEYEDKIIWQWSENKMFAQVATPVRIPGGRFHEFEEIWIIKPNNLHSEGTYTARSLFIASGQEVTETFQVKLIK